MICRRIFSGAELSWTRLAPPCVMGRYLGGLTSMMSPNTDVDVQHILKDGALESHAALERRLLTECRMGEGDLFEPYEERLARAYRRWGERIAWQSSSSRILRCGLRRVRHSDDGPVPAYGRPPRVLPHLLSSQKAVGFQAKRQIGPDSHFIHP